MFIFTFVHFLLSLNNTLHSNYMKSTYQVLLTLQGPAQMLPVQLFRAVIFPFFKLPYCSVTHTGHNHVISFPNRGLIISPERKFLKHM